MPCLVKRFFSASFAICSSARPRELVQRFRIPTTRHPDDATQNPAPGQSPPAPITPRLLGYCLGNSSLHGGVNDNVARQGAQGGIFIGREPAGENHVLGFPVTVHFCRSASVTSTFCQPTAIAVASDCWYAVSLEPAQSRRR